MAVEPGMSLPKQAQTWADLKSAYRFFNNPRVDSGAIGAPHRRQVLQMCARHAVVLVAQDTTELDFTRRRSVHGLGPIGTGEGRGLLQHSALAVTTQGTVLGVLDQRFLVRGESHTGESRTELKNRWRESFLWGEGVGRVGRAPGSCRLILLSDRASDCFETIAGCDEHGWGFVVRALRDRNVDGKADHLWSWAGKQPVCGTMTVQVSAQSTRRGAALRIRRAAAVSIRFGAVTLDAPLGSAHDPRKLWAVYAREEEPPTGEGVERVEWLLLCSEPVEDQAAARRMLEWYTRRWVIEEWHRALKEGCRMEASQLHDAEAIKRLATLKGVVAARLLQLRDQADPANPEAEDPAALRRAVPEVWIEVVGVYTDVDAATLTPRQFWLSIARKGGFIGRKGDGRPGWKVIWRGWTDYSLMVEYALAMRRRE
jgi:hypothetical protein